MTIQQMMLAGSGLREFSVTIAADTTNYNLLTVLMAAPYNWDNLAPARVTVTINSAVQVTSTSTATPAFTTGSFVANSLLYIINNGSIKGKGGAGGVGVNDSPPYTTPAAGNGGTALSIASTLSGKVTITNGSGEIFGGGGGGGGGGSAMFNTGSGKSLTSWHIGGGGGGGGAGTGAGGLGGDAIYGDSNYNGLPGSAGTTLVGGAGGAQYCLAECNGAGGAGGGFGAAGVVGGNGYSNNGGLAGGAGNAIALNGGSSPTFISGNDGTHVKGAVS